MFWAALENLSNGTKFLNKNLALPAGDLALPAGDIDLVAEGNVNQITNSGHSNAMLVGAIAFSFFIALAFSSYFGRGKSYSERYQMKENANLVA